MKQGKRKGETEGTIITFGERLINWAKAAAIIIPVLGIGAVGNAKLPAIWQGLAEADGKTEVIKGAPADVWRDSVNKFSHEIRAEIERIDLDRATDSAALDAVNRKLAKQDRTNYQALVEKLKIQEQELTILKGLVN